MILSQDKNIFIVNQEKATIIELVKKLEALYPKFKNFSVIVNLSSLSEIKNEDVVEFLHISNMHRSKKQSFVIVSDKININDSLDQLIIVPTMKEAYDIIEMEDMERDLGL